LSGASGRTIARKHGGLVPTDIVDVATLASVEVSSEEELYPVDHLFDGRNGPGGSCWMAAAAGAQVIVLRFHRPLARLDTVVVESEERSDTRTQKIELSGWSELTQRPFEHEARELKYSPYGTSFHRATWELLESDVPHLRLRVVPDGSRDRVSLTAIVLRSRKS
jgi:hypothetical protein